MTNSPYLFRLVSSVVAFVLIAVLAWSIDSLEVQKQLQEQRTQAVAHLTTIRANLEKTINTRIQLARGLAAFAKITPEFTPTQFARFATELQGDIEGIPATRSHRRRCTNQSGSPGGTFVD
jgi:two-component system, sensor histidine kinase ChiS